MCMTTNAAFYKCLAYASGILCCGVTIFLSGCISPSKTLRFDGAQGTVVDARTGLPVQGAEVAAAGDLTIHHATDSAGGFNLERRFEYHLVSGAAAAPERFCLNDLWIEPQATARSTLAAIVCRRAKSGWNH